MKAIIGLGNPEVKYMNTRHNIGFMVIDSLLKEKGLTLSDKFQSFFAKDGDTLFLMPKTYMNLSGRAVIELVNFYKLDIKDILVIYDDVTLELGTLRFRANGSDGSHNGMKSIINTLNSKDIGRLKVGVGPKPDFMDLSDYVLSSFKNDEKEKLDKTIEAATSAVNEYLKSDIISVQNKFNKNHL